MNDHPGWSPLTPTGALRAWWAVIMVVIATLATVLFTVAYVARTVRSNDQQWCSLLISLDQPLPLSPPPSGRQQTIAQQIHALRVRKDC